MLSPEEVASVEQELAGLPTKRAACIGALRAVQRARGFVSDEALADLAPVLGMTPTELEAVATCYNLIYRRPVGRHVILLCDSISCFVTGQRWLQSGLEERLGIHFGETTADGRFTLLPCACLGICDHAPAMMVDDDLCCDFRREDLPRQLDELLARYE